MNAGDEDGRTLLHWASSCGHLEISEFLLNEFKADPNTEDDEGWTPFLSTCASGKLGVAKLLASSGADIKKTNKQGLNALFYACSKGHFDVASFLLNQGLSPNVSDKYGNTPLHRSVRNLKMVEMLLEKGASVDRVNKEGQSPLHLAAEEGEEEVCKLLLKKGADSDRKDKHEKTPKDYGGKVLASIW